VVSPDWGAERPLVKKRKGGQLPNFFKGALQNMASHEVSLLHEMVSQSHGVSSR
jgi:hypothetical protein